MARSTKTTSTKPAAATKPAVRTKRGSTAAEPAPVAPPPATTKNAGARPTSAAKPSAGRGRPAIVAVPAAAPTRVPPPSKGELRAQIEKLEAANVALKAKGREANRTAKAADHRIAELEKQVTQLQTEAAAKPGPVAPPAPEVKTVRHGRPPGRSKTVDPGDAVPPGVAVQNPEPLDEEAAAARTALENHSSGK